MHNAPEVLIYVLDSCPFCKRAEALLQSYAVDYKRISIEDKPEVKAHMTLLSRGRTSVPQIWINSQHIGGCDDLLALEEQGKLRSLLSPS